MRMRIDALGLLVPVALAGCRPSDILSVPAPASVIGSAAVNSEAGAEGVFNGAKGQFFSAVDGFNYGIMQWSGLLTDELTWSAFTSFGVGAYMDARFSAGGPGYTDPAAMGWTALLTSRASLLLSIPLLAKYEPASEQSKVGEAYALVGYSELILAESFCAGTPLDEVPAAGGIKFGMPLTTDSMLGAAQAAFESAVANAHGDATVAAFASVGLGRALVGRGQYAAAATAVQNVPTTFLYNVELQPNDDASPYAPSYYSEAYEFNSQRQFNVADRDGGSGLDFVSAHDPRLTFDTTGLTADGTVWYMPLKFEANLALMPLATGIEARLIVTEAELHAGQAASWLAGLNALRNSGCTISGGDTTCSLGSGQVAGQTVGLPSLSDPGTDSGRVSLMFRERAFWLYGTGTRLGDLRRLIRQYGRNQSTVFPSGVYANGENPGLPSPIPNYGTDVSIEIPSLREAGSSVTNPNYRGCLTGTSTP